MARAGTRRGDGSRIRRAVEGNEAEAEAECGCLELEGERRNVAVAERWERWYGAERRTSSLAIVVEASGSPRPRRPSRCRGGMRGGGVVRGKRSAAEGDGRLRRGVVEWTRGQWIVGSGAAEVRDRSGSVDSAPR